MASTMEPRIVKPENCNHGYTLLQGDGSRLCMQCGIDVQDSYEKRLDRIEEKIKRVEQLLEELNTIPEA